MAESDDINDEDFMAGLQVRVCSQGACERKPSSVPC